MNKLIIANWKMNKDFSEIDEYCKYLDKNVKDKDGVIVCVPSVFIKTVSDNKKTRFSVGAENCHYEKKGAFTGEISAQMVRSAGAEYVIIGHSERRQLFGETNEFLNKKLHAALGAGLKPIFCIGETLEQKDKFKSVLKKQIEEGFAKVEDFSNIVVAYEPVWAIGTGKVATTKDIEKVHSYIRSVFETKFNVKVRIVYGGSVSTENCGEILSLDEVDGVLVGGASLDPVKFTKIIESR